MWDNPFSNRRVGAGLVPPLLLFVFCLLPFNFPIAQTPSRLAVIDLLGDRGSEIASLLRASAREDKTEKLELIDEDLTRVAARGSGYTGNLNLSRDEARALGQSLGCDFYILGKVQVTRRLVTSEQFYAEALAGIFIVEARTGRLINFVFERAQKQSEQEAYQRLKESIKSGWQRYAQAIISAREKHLSEIEEIAQVRPPAKEIFSDETEAKGLQQPFFYERLKPAYTEQADLAGITATVELEAVFGEDGRVGDVEVVKWAGYGLDESAIATVRMLRFKPAERDGKRLTFRGLVRYNFRRPLSQAVQPQAQNQEDLERLKQNLRDVLNPGRKP